MTTKRRCPGGRRSPAAALIGLVAALVVLAACQGPSGTIEDAPSGDAPETEPTEAATTPAVTGFSPDVPDGICPDSSIVPEDHLIQGEYTSEEVIGPADDEAETDLECRYEWIDDDDLTPSELSGLEGVWVASIDVSVYEPGRDAPDFVVPNPIDFEEHPEAAYVEDWDESALEMETEEKSGPYSPGHTWLLVHARTENIHVSAGAGLFFTDDGADAEAAAFAIAEDLTTAVIEALPRV